MWADPSSFSTISWSVSCSLNQKWSKSSNLFYWVRFSSHQCQKTSKTWWTSRSTINNWIIKTELRHQRPSWSIRGPLKSVQNHLNCLRETKVETVMRVTVTRKSYRGSWEETSKSHSLSFQAVRWNPTNPHVLKVVGTRDCQVAIVETVKDIAVSS